MSLAARCICSGGFPYCVGSAYPHCKQMINLGFGDYIKTINIKKTMPTEKRKPRSYKIADTPYNKALKKQKKPPLATFVEEVVTAIGNGQTITVNPKAAEEKLKQ